LLCRRCDKQQSCDGSEAEKFLYVHVFSPGSAAFMSRCSFTNGS
jgi:hypothetical protein